MGKPPELKVGINYWKWVAERRLELLRRLEFAGGDWSDRWCPICAYSGEELKGHAADCELAKELSAYTVGEGGYR